MPIGAAALRGGTMKGFALSCFGVFFLMCAPGLMAGTPSVTLTPTALAFAAQAVGSSSHKNVNIKNTGTAYLYLNSITINGSNFSISSFCGPRLAPGYGCDVWVYFKPTLSGPRSGSLIITTDALSSPDTVTLSGEGTGGGSPPPPAVAISIAPTSATLQANSTRQFSATVTNATNTSVTWLASGDGGITTTGLFTAGTITGTATVTAASVQDGSKSATATVTVTAPPPPSSPALVQAKPLGANAFGVVSLPFDKVNAAGNTIVVGIDYGDPSGAISSVTDSAGNNYTADNSLLVDVGAGLVMQVWVAKNIVAYSAGNVVSVTPSGGNAINMCIAEFFPGAVSTGLRDASSGAVSSGSGVDAMDSGLMTTNGTEILIGWGRASSEQPSPGTFWTQAALSADHQLLEYRVNVPAGVGIHATESVTASNHWAMQIVALNK